MLEQRVEQVAAPVARVGAGLRDLHQLVAGGQVGRERKELVVLERVALGLRKHQPNRSHDAPAVLGHQDAGAVVEPVPHVHVLGIGGDLLGVLIGEPPELQHLAVLLRGSDRAEVEGPGRMGDPEAGQAEILHRGPRPELEQVLTDGLGRPGIRGGVAHAEGEDALAAALRDARVQDLEVEPDLSQGREGAGARDGHPGQEVLVAKAGLELHALAGDVGDLEVDEVPVEDRARGDAGGGEVRAAGPAHALALVARGAAARRAHPPAHRHELLAVFPIGEDHRKAAKAGDALPQPQGQIDQGSLRERLRPGRANELDPERADAPHLPGRRPSRTRALRPAELCEDRVPRTDVRGKYRSVNALDLSGSSGRGRCGARFQGFGEVDLHPARGCLRHLHEALPDSVVPAPTTGHPGAVFSTWTYQKVGSTDRDANQNLLLNRRISGDAAGGARPDAS